MDGPGPSTQANADARRLRATRRAAGEAARGAQESQSNQSLQRGRQEDDSSSDEDESSDDENDEEGGQKKPDVYHHEIWKKLLKKGSMGGRLRYVNGQPRSGTHPLDITVVEESQMTWDMNDRRFWPKNLTLWRRPNPWYDPTYEVGVMKYKGRLVLDYKGDPIRNFKIPLTISSQIEGLRIESWLRSDTRLTLHDIEAREWTKVTEGVRSPMFDRRALSKRASNDRARVGILSWALRSGREAHIAFMDNLRTPAQRARNLATDKDLTSKQKGNYDYLGVNKERESIAPNNGSRIRKIKARAERDEDEQDDTVTKASVGAENAGPADPVAMASDDDDSLSDDTDGDEVVQESYIHDETPDDDNLSDNSDGDEIDQEFYIHDETPDDDTDNKGSLSSSLIDPSDSRHDEPMDLREQAWLQRALWDTAKEFKFLTGQEPQLRNEGENYFSQWSMMQEELRNLWAARGNQSEAPRLQAKDRWTGGISRYYNAEVIEGGEYDDESGQAREEGA